MPKYISGKEFEKKVLDVWENEGGRVSTDEMNLKEINIHFKSEGIKELEVRSADAGSPKSAKSETDPLKASEVTRDLREQCIAIYSHHTVYC